MNDVIDETPLYEGQESRDNLPPTLQRLPNIRRADVEPREAIIAEIHGDVYDIRAELHALRGDILVLDDELKSHIDAYAKSSVSERVDALMAAELHKITGASMAVAAMSQKIMEQSNSSIQQILKTQSGAFFDSQARVTPDEVPPGHPVASFFKWIIAIVAVAALVVIAFHLTK